MAVATTPSSAKKRKNNFSHPEIMTLLEAVAEHKEILCSSFSSTVTNKRKQEVWAHIAQTVSLVGENRSSQEVREKWGGLKKKFRERQTARSRSGNGFVPASPYDHMIEEIIGRDSQTTNGINDRHLESFVENSSQISRTEPPISRNLESFENGTQFLRTEPSISQHTARSASGPSISQKRCEQAHMAMASTCQPPIRVNGGQGPELHSIAVNGGQGPEDDVRMICAENINLNETSIHSVDVNLSELTEANPVCTVSLPDPPTAAEGIQQRSDGVSSQGRSAKRKGGKIKRKQNDVDDEKESLFTYFKQIAQNQVKESEALDLQIQVHKITLENQTYLREVLQLQKKLFERKMAKMDKEKQTNNTE